MPEFAICTTPGITAGVETLYVTPVLSLSIWKLVDTVVTTMKELVGLVLLGLVTPRRVKPKVARVLDSAKVTWAFNCPLMILQ